MSNAMAVKSILKQSKRKRKSAGLTDEQKTKAEQDKRNLDIALHHANRIQTQKQIQNLIVSNVEALLDLPAGPQHTSAEAAKFARLIWPFQPSDFNALIEERRSESKCGYVLCSKEPRSVTLGESASWKLKGQGAGDYCSTECVRKSMYVKAQLSGVPAWEREPGVHADIILPESDRPVLDGAVQPAQSRSRVTNDGARELAMERGEQSTNFRPKQVMMDTLIEKQPTKRAVPPSGPNGASCGTIEGYMPRGLFKPKKDGDEDNDEDLDGYGDSNSEHDEEDAAIVDEVQRDLGRRRETAAEIREREEEEQAWRDLDAGLEELSMRGGT